MAWLRGSVKLLTSYSYWSCGPVSPKNRCCPDANLCRLGQTSETAVYWYAPLRVDSNGGKSEFELTRFSYATEQTVESRILAQGVRNNTSIYLADDHSLDGQQGETSGDMQNVPSAASKGGDLGSDGREEELLELIL
jgi:hypothetical protein